MSAAAAAATCWAAKGEAPRKPQLHVYTSARRQGDERVTGTLWTLGDFQASFEAGEISSGSPHISPHPPSKPPSKQV